MNILITGANGFVGQVLAKEFSKELSKGNIKNLTLTDLSFSNYQDGFNKNIRFVEGDFNNTSVRESFLENGSDVLFHLASLPGGASEQDPKLSREVNLDATLALFEELALRSPKSKLIFCSSIAVFGKHLPEVVTDNTPVTPSTLVYGTHKAMIELALANMNQRKLLDAVSVRLPGIVARPANSGKLKSAFMSDVFHSLQQGNHFTCPVSEKSTMWMLSVQQCVTNLMDLSQVDLSGLPEHRAITMPALRCVMSELVDEIVKQVDGQLSSVKYEPDSELEAVFGALPKLETKLADCLGLENDESIQRLVSNVLQTI